MTFHPLPFVPQEQLKPPQIVSVDDDPARRQRLQQRSGEWRQRYSQSLRGAAAGAAADVLAPQDDEEEQVRIRI